VCRSAVAGAKWRLRGCFGRAFVARHLTETARRNYAREIERLALDQTSIMGFLKSLRESVTGRQTGTPGPTSGTPKPAQTSKPASMTRFQRKASSASHPAAFADEPASAAHPENRVTRRLLYVSGDEQERGRFVKLLADQGGWAVTCGQSAANALELFERDAFDGVVAEPELPDADGPKLLDEIVKRSPRTVRFLRRPAEDKTPVKSAHAQPPYVLGRELAAALLDETLMRSFLLETWISNDAIRVLLPQMQKLPALPSIYNRVVSELQSPDASLETVARLIATDPVMTAKMLQLVNSAFFGLPRSVTSPVDAVMFLGSERTKALILVAHVFSQFDETKCAGFSVDAQWRHSMETGSFAQTIVTHQLNDTKLAELAFTAGLLHDLGKLLLAANLPEKYSHAINSAHHRNLPVRETETEVFGTTHAELGACLLGIWGLPLPILEAVAWHHVPLRSLDREFSLLTAVHAANALVYEKHGDIGEERANAMDLNYLGRLGLLDRRNPWRCACDCSRRPADDSPFEQARRRQDARAR
jgi:HD-like signal output (HDOD) protein/CheY-like chemotaxis protein